MCVCVDDTNELRCCSAVGTVWLRPRESYPLAVGSDTNGTFLEADSHADTTGLGLGGGALKILDYDNPVNVHGYDPSLGPKQYSVIFGGVAYVHSHSGLRYHFLIFHKAIHMPDLEHHLMCPMRSKTRTTVK